MSLAEYQYELPKKLIGLTPANPRDSAKLLVYSRATDTVTHGTFRDLASFLPKGSLLVLNDTKVIPARLSVAKPTGGKVEIFYLRTEGALLRVLMNASLPDGTVLCLGRSHTFTVVKKIDREYLVRPSFQAAKIISVLGRFGTTPLPPYLKHSPLSERKRRSEYQTVFARTRGSVAAPTASLHFTKRLLAKLIRSGVEVVRVTLHVGLGTFAPVTEEHVRTGKLHTEQWSVSAKAAAAINRAKKEGRMIIPVGTTALRTIESWYAATGNRHGGANGETSLFIRPGYECGVANGLITNFHVPGSSLLMLVAALVGKEKMFELYRAAIKRRYRFFSFGDGMLIL